jgi:hypothetical protein
MIHLFVTLKDRAVGTYDVPGDRVRIGRHPDNEVHIDSMAVSRNHCVLSRTPQGGWVVEDLGGSNGTYVNGARVQRHAAVRDGDVLGIGKFQVSFRSSPADALAATSPGGADAPELRELTAPLKGYLIVQNRPGPVVPLERDAFIIGAGAGVDLLCPGPSRRALIVRGYGGFQLIDVGPTPGQVTLQGAPVPDRAWLHEGDVLTVGELQLQFHVGLPTDEQSTMSIQVPLGGFKKPPGFA